MIKKNVLIFLSIAIVWSLYSNDVVWGQHLSKNEVNSLRDYSIVYNIAIEDKEVSIFAKESIAQNKVSTRKYETTKIVVLKDTNGNFLDSFVCEIYENTGPTSSFVDEGSISFSTKVYENIALQNKIIFGFVYINQHSNNIEFYKALDKNSFIGSVVVSDDYIIFTTDLGPNLAKISLKTREITPYDTSVSGNLYAFDRAPYIALLEQGIEYNRVTERKTILDEPKQYLITETDVIPATKNYEVREAQKLIDFRSW